MARSLTEGIGFALPDLRGADPQDRTAMLELIASAALAISTAVVVAIVTIGAARAASLAAPVAGG